MLTMFRLKLGEGELIEGDPEIGSRRTFSRTMYSPRGEEEGHAEREKHVISETEFLEAFMSMKAMMEILLDERPKRKKIEDGFCCKILILLFFVPVDCILCYNMAYFLLKTSL